MAKAKKNITVKKDIGLGDVVETITKKTGIKKAVKTIIGNDCGCNGRKKALNKIKLSRGIKARCFTKKEHSSYKEFLANKTIKDLTETKTIDFICKLHSDVLSTPYFKPNKKENTKPIIKMINNLDVVYKAHERD